MRTGEDLSTRPRPLVEPARVRVNVIGCGYWGPHLARNLHEVPDVELVAVCDPQPERLDYVATGYPGVSLFADHRELLAADVDAVGIATPIHTHHALVRDTLLLP